MYEDQLVISHLYPPPTMLAGCASPSARFSRPLHPSKPQAPLRSTWFFPSSVRDTFLRAYCVPSFVRSTGRAPSKPPPFWRS